MKFQVKSFLKYRSRGKSFSVFDCFSLNLLMWFVLFLTLKSLIQLWSFNSEIFRRIMNVEPSFVSVSFLLLVCHGLELLEELMEEVEEEKEVLS